jgi:membrane carboxypeptidase/penicillin-binding protein
VRRVEDTEGNVLFRAEETAVPAVSPATAFLMSSMLADVIDSGTGWKARQLGFRLPASGKTGTTNEYRDAWFVGYTPSLTAGVWVGYDTPRQILPGSAYAGDVAVPLWAEFMKAATANDKPERLAAPRNIVGVTVCRLSGKRPAGGCDAVPVVDDDGHESERSMIGTEYFVRGTEPDQLCHLHVGRSFFGRLAGWLGNEPRAEVTQQRANESAPAEAPATAAAASPDEKAEEVATAPAPERKKRGFWSRLFGRGDKDDKDKDEKDKDEKKDPPDNRRRR